MRTKAETGDKIAWKENRGIIWKWNGSTTIMWSCKTLYKGHL